MSTAEAGTIPNNMLSNQSQPKEELFFRLWRGIRDFLCNFSFFFFNAAISHFYFLIIDSIHMEKLYTIKLRILFSYKPFCNLEVQVNYVTTYKIIHIYYLNKSHDSLNKSCDLIGLQNVVL